MGLIASSAVKTTASWSSPEDSIGGSSRRRAAALVMCLCLLINRVDGLILPGLVGWGNSGSGGVPWTRKTMLSATDTESPTTTSSDFTFDCTSPFTAIVTPIMSSDSISTSDDDEEDRAEESRDDDEESSTRDEEADDDEQLTRQTAAAAAALLRRKGTGTRSRKSLKNTSVGSRRVGSATRARQSESRTSKVISTVRTVAAAAAASETTNTTTTSSTTNSTKSSEKMGNSVIQSTISTIMEQQNEARRASGGRTTMSLNRFHGPAPMGVLGERPDPLSHELLRNPMPGTVLVVPSKKKSAATTTRLTPESLSVRVATPADDFQIANLRLSVFSEFSNELRKQFCARSCQVLSDRRLRGATCIVATRPYTNRGDVVLGSIELSVHEFYATKLGQSRPNHSILYVTEVAVSPSYRRCGIGSKLLEGVDKLAKLRRIETLYLHVDVLNKGALELYRKAGYVKVVDQGNPIYGEFTTSLNLHDGATKGRKHFLLQKHLRNPTWIPLPNFIHKVNTTTWAYPQTAQA